MARLISCTSINKTWRRCLELKASAHLYFDQHLLGYGNNALEAWAMGMPVIAGASDLIIDRMRREWGYLPFYRMGLPGLLDLDVGAMARSADLRSEWAERGMAHIARYHTPEAVAERAHELYELVAKRPIAA